MQCHPSLFFFQRQRDSAEETRAHARERRKGHPSTRNSPSTHQHTTRRLASCRLPITCRLPVTRRLPSPLAGCSFTGCSDQSSAACHSPAAYHSPASQSLVDQSSLAHWLAEDSIQSAACHSVYSHVIASTLFDTQASLSHMLKFIHIPMQNFGISYG